jgi:hypothetical protein
MGIVELRLRCVPHLLFFALGPPLNPLLHLVHFQVIKESLRIKESRKEDKKEILSPLKLLVDNFV